MPLLWHKSGYRVKDIAGMSLKIIGRESAIFKTNFSKSVSCCLHIIDRNNADPPVKVKVSIATRGKRRSRNELKLFLRVQRGEKCKDARYTCSGKGCRLSGR